MTITPNRGYSLLGSGPNGWMSEDFAPLNATLQKVDGDVHALFAALSGKRDADASIGMDKVTGLNDALTGKAAAGHSHQLTDLSDVDATQVGEGYLLARQAGSWVPVSVNAVFGQFSVNINSVDGLADALNAKAASDHNHDAAYLGKTATAANSLKLGNVAAAEYALVEAVAIGLAAKLNSASYTAADVLAKLKTVDTDEAGINATTLQGHDPEDFALASAAPVLTFLDDMSSASLTNSVAHSFSSVTIGDAVSDRMIMVTVGAMQSNAGSPNRVTSVTVGGVSLSRIDKSDTDDARCCCGVFMGIVPTGSTATVVANFQVSCAGVCAQVYRVDGLTEPLFYDAAYETENGSTTSQSLEVMAPSASVTIAVEHKYLNESITWTGDVTEIQETLSSGGQAAMSVASVSSTAADPSVAATATWSSSTQAAISLVTLR